MLQPTASTTACFPSPARTAREAVRPTTSPFVVKGMLPTRPSTVQARNFASDDTMSGVNDARTPYWPPQIPATHPSEMYNIDSSRELLDKLRVRQTQQLALSGRGCQSDLQERWQEMHAWCGYLATNLEGACCRIEQLGDERRDLLSRQDEMGNAVRQLEYRASNKNVARLEQTIQQLQQDLRDRDASIQQLTADLKEGASVEMPAEQQHLVSRVLEETLAELGLSSPVEAQGVGVGEHTSPPPKAVKRKSSQGLKRLETATRVALVAASQAAREAAAKAEALKTPEEEARRRYGGHAQLVDGCVWLRFIGHAIDSLQQHPQPCARRGRKGQCAG